MTDDPKPMNASADPENPGKGRKKPAGTSKDEAVDVPGDGSAASGDSSAAPGDSESSEDIEILDVTAADEAGVPIEEEDDEDAEPVIIDEEEQEEFELSGEEFDTSSRRSGGDRRAEASAELDAARAQVQELREQILRTTADFDNFRKRVERDRIEERKQATAGLVRNVLPVLDSFRWALVSAQKGEDAAVKGFAEGFRLIETQLLEVLKSAGLESVDATGIFDPTVHEALMQETTTDKPHMQVLEVFEPGWRLGGRLLRPARVKVANNPSAPSAPEGGSSSDSSSEAESATTH